jgi:hypothetical protein
MNLLKITLLATSVALLSLPLAAQQKRVSPHETVSKVIGSKADGNRITIVYGRPYSKSSKTGLTRTIWGSLIPWDEAYRLGADESTLLITQKALAVGTTTIPAGAYTIYLVPSLNGTSKLAFSTQLGTWGEPVDEAHDLARVDLEKSSLESDVPQLTIKIEAAKPSGGTIKISWEKTQFSLPFTVQK